MSEEVIAYGKTFKEFVEEGLNLPGVVILVAARENFHAEDSEYLIGEINGNGGACNCCALIYKDDTVISYRTVWKEKP